MLNTLAQNQDELLANQYFQNKEYEKAVILYEKLFDSKQEYLYYTPLLTCYIELKNYDKAEKLIKRMIKKNENNYYFKVDLGYIYSIAGEYKKKDKHFENLLLETTSLIPEKIIELANAFINRNEYDWAMKVYLQARKNSKSNYGYYLELADLYLKKGDYAMMIEQYLDAITYNIEHTINAKNILQDILSQDPKGEKSELLRKALLKRIQNNPNETIFSDLLLWYYIQMRDFESAYTHAKALDRRLKGDGEKLMDLGKICFTNEAFDIAIKCYKSVVELGKDKIYYYNAKIELVNALYSKITSKPNYTLEELKEAESLYKTTIEELGKNASSAYLIKDYAHLLAFFLDRPQEAINLLEEIIKIPNLNATTKAECKLELADIYVLSGDVWEATLLYGQVEKQFKNEPIGHLAKFKNAQLSYYKGDFLWAQAQLTVLKAATSKLIANDALQLSMIIIDNIDPDSGYIALEKYAKAELLIAQHKYDSAFAMLDSIKTLFLSHPIFDEIYFKKAEILEKTGKYQEAANLYQKIVDEYSQDILADDALFRLAILYEKIFKDTEKAKELYKKLIIDYSGSVYVADARKKFRILRGDVIQ